MSFPIERRPGERALSQRQHPYVAALDRVEVHRETPPVGREHRVVEVPPLRRDQPAAAGPIHEHER